MKGWQREIIDPIEAVIAPKKLLWKEKWGLIRVEWIKAEDGSLSDCPFDMVIEEASKLCCMECGRWNEWWAGDDSEPARVSRTRTGWIRNLCQFCQKKMLQEELAGRRMGEPTEQKVEGYPGNIATEDVPYTD